MNWGGGTDVHFREEACEPPPPLESPLVLKCITQVPTRACTSNRAAAQCETVRLFTLCSRPCNLSSEFMRVGEQGHMFAREPRCAVPVQIPFG